MSGPLTILRSGVIFLISLEQVDDRAGFNSRGLNRHVLRIDRRISKKPLCLNKWHDTWNLPHRWPLLPSSETKQNSAGCKFQDLKRLESHRKPVSNVIFDCWKFLLMSGAQLRFSPNRTKQWITCWKLISINLMLPFLSMHESLKIFLEILFEKKLLLFAFHTGTTHPCLFSALFSRHSDMRSTWRWRSVMGLACLLRLNVANFWHSSLNLFYSAAVFLCLSNSSSTFLPSVLIHPKAAFRA